MRKPTAQRDNFIYLTVALLSLLFCLAIVDQFAGVWAQQFVQAAIIVTLILSIWGSHTKRRWHRASFSFIGLILLLTFVIQVFHIARLHYLYLLLMLCFFILSAWLAIRQVLFTGAIDTNKILGAICVYLLLGIIWAIIYTLIADINPGTFNGHKPEPWHKSFPDFIYFSFVTLTTLGYGDITPATSVSRFLTYMEAVIGQFYLAILVASLVGIRISTQHIENSTQNH